MVSPPSSDFQRFFAAEYARVVTSLTLAFGDRRAAEDAAQEGFSQALSRWTRVRRMQRPAGWVYTVALRYEWRRSRLLLRERTYELPGYYDNTLAVDDRLVVVGLLAALTARQRRAVVLRYHADLSLEEVAQALGCSLGTAKATLHQAITRMGIQAERDEIHAAR